MDIQSKKMLCKWLNNKIRINLQGVKVRVKKQTTMTTRGKYFEQLMI